MILLTLPFFMRMRPTATLTVGARSFTLDISSTPEQQRQGLGGRSSMPSDQGMVFVFDQVASQCMLMKNMQFPIDIVWLDSAKKVTYVESNVNPDTYPQQYCGDASTKYVVELAAGEALRAGLAPGVQVSL